MGSVGEWLEDSSWKAYDRETGVYFFTTTYNNYYCTDCEGSFWAPATAFNPGLLLSTMYSLRVLLSKGQVLQNFTCTMRVISTWDTSQKTTKSKKAIISINHRIATPLNNQFHSFLNLAPSPPNNVETVQRATTLNLIYQLI